MMSSEKGNWCRFWAFRYEFWCFGSILLRLAMSNVHDVTDFLNWKALLIRINCFKSFLRHTRKILIWSKSKWKIGKNHQMKLIFYLMDKICIYQKLKILRGQFDLFDYYYVSILPPPPNHLVSKRKHFANPTHPPFSLRNIWMVPYQSVYLYDHVCFFSFVILMQQYFFSSSMFVDNTWQFDHNFSF